MPNFAANISWLFTELDFLDRFEAASAAGFKGVECLFPYDYKASDYAARLTKHDLQAVLINAPPGDWDGGERGLAAQKGRESDFRDSLMEAIDYAHEIGCPHIHIMAGLQAGSDRQCYIDNLKWSGEALGHARMLGLIEPINTFDMPGYFLESPDQAAEILNEISSPHLGLQLDLYHVARMGLDPATMIDNHKNLIGHFQIAGVPQRHEPNTGDVNFEPLFQKIDSMPNDAWVGCEYKPRQTTNDGLAWLGPYL